MATSVSSAYSRRSLRISSKNAKRGFSKRVKCVESLAASGARRGSMSASNRTRTLFIGLPPFAAYCSLRPRSVTTSRKAPSATPNRVTSACPLAVQAESILDQLPQSLDRVHETLPLGPEGDKARQDGTHGHRVGNQAAALGRVHLPVASILPEEIVGVVGVEMPFDPTPNRIRVLDHVEAEGERTDTHHVPDKRVLRIGLHQLGADHPRVVPGMATIIDEHGPHALRGGPHEADRRS